MIWFVLAAVVAVLRRDVWIVVVVVVGVAAADGIAGLVKLAVGENRPDEPDPLITIPHSHSFPSGHTATAFAGATLLSAFVPRAAPAFYLLAAAIAYSRLYVGVHFPLDVVGGVVIGLVTALLLLSAARRRSVRAPRSG
ncbi:MAG TPA: phosphatase PAP2 family protein [Gaiellaceae bacterium]